MASTTRYTVRNGFVMLLELPKAGGGTQTREYGPGEEVALEPDQYELHAHKLELADPKARAKAAEAEAAAKVAAAAAQTPGDMAAQFFASLQQLMALQVGQAATAPAAPQQ